MWGPVNLVITFVDALYITSAEKTNDFAETALAIATGDVLKDQLAFVGRAG
jgi:predicted nucleic acid-binding protein